MKDKFPEMENYTVLSQFTPDVFGYMNSVTVVGKNNGDEVYRMPRTSQYVAAYSPIRDRMFMGLHVAYTKIIEMLKDKPINNGGFKNYFFITVETGNDMPQKVISFDGYIIKAEDPDDLVLLNKFNSIPGINDKTLHSAIFLINRQYEKDMDLIDAENLVFHMKAYRHRAVKVDTFKLEACKYDMEDENCQRFIQSVFNGTNRSMYSIGLKVEPTDLLRNITGYIPLKKKEDATKPTENSTTAKKSKAAKSEPKREMKDLGVLDVGEVLGNDATVISKGDANQSAKTVEIED